MEAKDFISIGANIAKESNKIDLLYMVSFSYFDDPCQLFCSNPSALKETTAINKVKVKDIILNLLEEIDKENCGSYLLQDQTSQYEVAGDPSSQGLYILLRRGFSFNGAEERFHCTIKEVVNRLTSLCIDYNIKLCISSGQKYITQVIN